MKKKKRNGGKHAADGRKPFTVRLTFERYQKFCDIAGMRSLSDALEDMIRSTTMRLPDEKAPPSHK